MNAKRWIALAAAAALLLVSVSVSLVTGALQTDVSGMFDQETSGMEESIVEEGSGAGKAALIHVDGVIQAGGASPFGGGYNHQLVLDQLDHAAEDASVDGIILRVNTPGGGVVESDEIYDKIVEVQEEYSKDVYVSMGNQAASGGYYISAPAAQIYANPQTITGSLGVIMQSFNVSELAEELGIEDQTIKSGEFKDIMSATREMTEEDEDILQGIVDDAYEQFVTVIDEGRDNLSRDEVMSLADGRIYTGSQAEENGLIDGLGNLDDVIDAMREDTGQDLTVVEYAQGFGFDSFFGMSLDSLFEQRRIDQLTGWLEDQQGPQLMYLYTD
ncbi:signal peptide peptidase SppA [Alkalicoccus urumqiensis]|uniref:Signal peptide peptidase SppA n=1 Tax=Alkalicoccus urumqiensis TaxID=1548213 RepID=A0A2P6MD98_ALKUR|nr:signal peptide peptidase SppA [Alkalicoccus urumqiensis]PRO64240.1 signal peptide peptidase SppA [Alkalicoccus urumqiensis]